MHLYYLHASMCVCQLLRPDEKSTSTQRYIDSRTVQPKAKGSWISVDVTETIKDWVSDPGEVELVCKPNFSFFSFFLTAHHITSVSSCFCVSLCSENNLGLKLGVHCPCCTFIPSTNNIVPNKSEELEALFAGLFFFFHCVSC